MKIFIQIQKLCRMQGEKSYETYMVGVAEASPLAGDVEMMKAENWRLRPAMADNGLS